MRSGVFVSSLLIAGFAQVAPALAQSEDRTADTATALPAAKPAKPAPVLATPNGQVMDKARELAEADLAAAPDEEIKPLKVDPNIARKRDLALPNPAPKPVAEPEPVLAERPPLAEAEAHPALAEAKPAPEATPVLAERETGSEPMRDSDPVVKPGFAPRRHDVADAATADPDGGDPVVRPVYRERRWQPRPVEQAARAPVVRPAPRGSDARPDYVEAERIVRTANAPAIETAEVAPAREAPPVARAARVAEAAPAAEAEQVAEAAPQAGDGIEITEAGDSGRELLRDAARAAKVVRQAGRVAGVLGGTAVGGGVDAPAHAEDDRIERDERPVYAEVEPEDAPIHAEDAREADRDYDRPARRAPAPVYAEDERDYPPVHDRGEAPVRPRFGGYEVRDRWAARTVSDACDGFRYEGLTRAVRRAAEAGSIDWRTARDMEDEIAHGEDMQRSYCASGLNDWRAQRLDIQYSQIEDRLRFERGRR